MSMKSVKRMPPTTNVDKASSDTWTAKIWCRRFPMTSTLHDVHRQPWHFLPTMTKASGPLERLNPRQTRTCHSQRFPTDGQLEFSARRQRNSRTCAHSPPLCFPRGLSPRCSTGDCPTKSTQWILYARVATNRSTTYYNLNTPLPHIPFLSIRTVTSAFKAVRTRLAVDSLRGH
jgi:hypothetical protein